MRIITGSARGIKLECIEGEETRPTSDRAKEALFSALQFDIEGRKVLDLFAGSGQLGLEAISRGAASAVFIDQNREACDIIIKNAKKASLFDRCRVSAGDYESFLKGTAGREKFDIIFLDPPYDSSFIRTALKLIKEGELLSYGGVVVCETETEEIRKKGKKTVVDNDKVSEKLFGADTGISSFYNIIKSSVYGRAQLTFLTLSDI